MRKTRLDLFSVALILLLAISGAAHANWTGTLEVWDFPRNPIMMEHQEQVIQEFERDFPGVRIEFTRLTWGGGGQRLVTAVASGSPPDLVGSGLRPDFAAEGLFEPINDYLTQNEMDDLLPNVKQVISLGDNIYGFPWYVVGGSLFLNLDIFEERGVTPPENGVWPSKEAFLEDMKRLTFDRNGDGTIDVYGLGMFMQPDYRAPLGFMYADGVVELSEDFSDYNLDKPEAIESFQWIVDLEHVHGVALPGVGGMNSADAYDAFLNQRTVAVVPQWTHVISAVRTQNAAIEAGEATGEPFNLGVAGFPIGKSGELISVSPGISSWVVYRQREAAKRDLLMELARRMTWTNEIVAIQSIGGFPVKASMGNIYEGDELFTTVSSYTHVVKPFHYNWAEINNVITREMQLAMLGQKTVEEALRDAGHVVRPLLHY